jgi:hypothetical protein
MKSCSERVGHGAEWDGSGRLAPRLLWLSLAVTVFLVTFLYRYLTVELFNDHFIWISGGRQILRYGAVPYRDFWDTGYFLQHYASAAVQLLFGDNLLGETLLSVSFISAGAALVFRLAAQASRSTLLGLLAASLVVAIFPRLYNYHKLFLYVFGLFLCWRYVDHPTPRGLAVIGAATGFSFLFRHDHGVYIFAATVAMLVGLHWRDGARVAARRLALYAGIVAVPVVAFLVFIELVEPKGGSEQYVQTSMAFVRTEPRRSALRGLPEFKIDLTVPLVEVDPPPPLPSAQVELRWSPEATAEDRLAVEQRYGLTSPARLSSDPSGRTWEYRFPDPTTARVRGLLEERSVEDTAGIDRSTGRVPVTQEEPPLSSWQRALPLLRARLAPGILQSANAAPWLCYLFYSVPVIALGLLLRDRLPARRTIDMGDWSKMLAATALCAVATPVLVRDPLEGRLGDVAAPTAVLGAWLLARGWAAVAAPKPASMTDGRHSLGRWRRRLGRVVGASALLVALSITVLSVASLGKIQENLVDGILGEARSIVSRVLGVTHSLGTRSIEEARWGDTPAIRALAK